MRPNWQVFLARELTARAQPSSWREAEGGRVIVTEAGTSGSHMVGALIVRQLLTLNPGLDRAMLSVPQASQEEWTGADKPPEFITAMNRMWNSVGVRASGEADPNRVAEALWELAQVAYLALPDVEIEAAKEIARRSVDLPWYGSRNIKAGGSESLIWGEGWEQGDWGTSKSADAFHGVAPDESSEAVAEAAGALASVLGGFGAEFGSLRSELYDATSEANRAEVMRTYDVLASNTSERRRWVRKWQEWAKSRGKYTAAIDGLWGPASESAWVALLPRSYGRPTTLADLQAMKAYGGIEAATVLAAAIARDKWIAANPNRLPPPPSTSPDTSTRIEEAPEAGQTPPEAGQTPSVEEETVVVSPEESETGLPPPPPPDRVEIVLPESGQVEHVTIVPVEEPSAEGGPGEKPKRNWLPWAIGIGTIALAGAFLLTGGRGKQPYELP
jgi:hypothetical protein